MEWIAIIVFGLILLTIFIYGQWYKRKLYKEVDRIDEWKMNIVHGNIPNELAKVKRLNMVGQTEQLFERWRKEWDDIITRQVPQIEEHIFDIEQYASRFQFKRAEQEILAIVQTQQNIEETVDRILAELDDLIGSEEKNKEEVEVIRAYYNDLHKTLLAHRHQFKETEKLLSDRLKVVKEQFGVFERETEAGDYLAAREILLRMRGLLEEIATLMEEVPDLFALCMTNYPHEYEDLKRKYTLMLNEGYILDHLMMDRELRYLEEEIEIALENVRQLAVKQCKERMEEIATKLTELNTLLDHEVESKQVIDVDMRVVLDVVDLVRVDIEKTKEHTHFVKLSYQISDKELEVQRYSESMITKLSVALEHLCMKVEGGQIAYSVLRAELQEVHDEVNEISEIHEQYKDMLTQLRKEELAARGQLDEAKNKLNHFKRILQRTNVYALPSMYADSLADVKATLHDVSVAIDSKPLDMVVVNDVLNRALNEVDAFCDETYNWLVEAHAAERYMQYAARFQGHQAEMDERMNRAHRALRSGQYREAFAFSKEVIDFYEPNRGEEILDEVKKAFANA
ncbi:MAG: septation ring formation regulator EzrA [Bacilli bacterium]